MDQMPERKRYHYLIREDVEAGLACVDAAKRNGRWKSAYSSRTPPRIPTDLESALKCHGALEIFTSMSNSAQLQYIFWIDQAKRPETRARRVTEAVRRLIQEAGGSL